MRWHGPNPDRLFDDYAVAGGKWAAKIKKRYEDTEPGDRTLEFGTTSSLGYEEEAETLLFVSERSQLPLAEQEAILLRAQATPLDLMQRTFPEVLQDTAQLTEFLQAYRASPQGGDTISIYSYSAGWVPADTEAFARMASGEPLEGYDGPYVPISYGVRSSLSVESRVAQTRLQFWVGHFQIDEQAVALAQEFGTLKGLSLVSLDGAYEDMRQLVGGNLIDLTETVVGFNEVVDETEFESGQILPWSIGVSLTWSIGVSLNGVAFSAIHAEVLGN